MRRRDRDTAARRLAALTATASGPLRRAAEPPSLHPAPAPTGHTRQGWAPARGPGPSDDAPGTEPGPPSPRPTSVPATAPTPVAALLDLRPPAAATPAAGPPGQAPRDDTAATLAALGAAADRYAAAYPSGDASPSPPVARPPGGRHPRTALRQDGRRVRPTGRARVRWAVTPRAAAAASIAVLLLAGAVALHAARSAPGVPVVLPTPGPAGTGGSTAVVVAEVVVDVVGEVAGPGVVRLPAGSRVVDAVAAAGGATAHADLAALNLARVLVDGEQIVVPRPGAPATAPTTAAAPASGAGGLVDLNTADLATLDTLPGVGPVLAQRIVDARAKHPFASVDELADVAGIGPTLLGRLRPLVRT